MNYYCDICDKTIKRKSKTRHNKSKSHLHMKSYIREKHTIGDVYWKDFYRVIREYVNTNRLKFPIFKTLVKCNLFDMDLVIWYDKTKKILIKYGYGDNVFHYLYPVCEEILKRIRDHVLIKGEKLSLETVIKNISFTFYSYYYIMTPRCRLEQPRRILESKLLKHITKLNDFEKDDKYGFLWHRYRPVSRDDNDVYFCLARL